MKRFLTHLFASSKNSRRHDRSYVSATPAPQRRCRVQVEELEPRQLLNGTTGALAPAAPSFSAAAVSASQINLAWTGVAGASGYLIDEWVNGAWSQIASLGNGSTSDAVSGLSPGTTYYFDLAAFNAAGTAWATSYQSATTLQGAPSAPSLTAKALSASQINLTWTGVAGASGYLVDEWANGAWRQIASLGSGSTGDAVSGLSPSTTYYFDLAAFNAAGTTWGSYQSATTPSITLAVDHPAAAKGYNPVSGSLFGANGPSWRDVQQGAVGDCWLLASLAEVAARAPSDIQKMFIYDGTTVENGSVVGVYTVRLFDNSGVPHNMMVDTELPAGGSYYDHVGSHVYAVVAYNPSSSQPFEVYNPWGTNSSGWAMGTYNGQQVYGLFNASAGFLSQNFTDEVVGVGAADGNGTHSVQRTTERSGAAALMFPQSGFTINRSSSHAIWDAIWAEA